MMIVPYPADPRYGVTRDGRVFRIQKARFGRAVPFEITQHVSVTGYPSVKFTEEGSRRTINRKVHRLVAETFLGERPPGFDVAHYDGNRRNPRAENLRWATRKENMSDARRHGTLRVGERCPGAKLTDAQAAEIKRRRQRGERGVELSAEFNISQAIVSQIYHGTRWAHV